MGLNGNGGAERRAEKTSTPLQSASQALLEEVIARCVPWSLKSRLAWLVQPHKGEGGFKFDVQHHGV